MPISFRVRSPGRPCRPYTPTLVNSRPRALATISAMWAAVPLGASFLKRMDLGDLHVVIVAEELRHVGQHAESDVHGHAHVRGEEDGDLPGEALDLLSLGRSEARGADHRPPA